MVNSLSDQVCMFTNMSDSNKVSKNIPVPVEMQPMAPLSTGEKRHSNIGLLPYSNSTTEGKYYFISASSENVSILNPVYGTTQAQGDDSTTGNSVYLTRLTCSQVGVLLYVNHFMLRLDHFIIRILP